MTSNHVEPVILDSWELPIGLGETPESAIHLIVLKSAVEAMKPEVLERKTIRVFMSRLVDIYNILKNYCNLPPT